MNNTAPMPATRRPQGYRLHAYGILLALAMPACVDESVSVSVNAKPAECEPLPPAPSDTCDELRPVTKLTAVTTMTLQPLGRCEAGVWDSFSVVAIPQGCGLPPSQSRTKSVQRITQELDGGECVLGYSVSVYFTELTLPPPGKLVVCRASAQHEHWASYDDIALELRDLRISAIPIAGSIAPSWASPSLSPPQHCAELISIDRAELTLPLELDYKVIIPESAHSRFQSVEHNPQISLSFYLDSQQ